MVRFSCDCCGKENLKVKETKQVCEECWKTTFEKPVVVEQPKEVPQQPIEQPIQPTEAVQQNQTNVPPFNPQGYLDFTK